MNNKVLFVVLKEALKVKKVTYSKLATKLNISEIGLKKLFARQDCSLSRLIEICDASGISLLQLIKSVEARSATTHELSTEAENFFAQNLNYFFFYKKLAQAQSVKSFKGNAGLDDKSILKYLKKLENLGLVEVHANEKIIFKTVEHTIGHRHGILAKALKKHLAPKYIQSVVSDNLPLGETWMFSSNLSQQSINELKIDIQNIVKKYRDRSEHERLMGIPTSEMGLVVGTGSEKVYSREKITPI